MSRSKWRNRYSYQDVLNFASTHVILLFYIHLLFVLGACNGRGKCVRIKDIAASDFNNTYQLWDADVTMGCDCDPGFRGPDCSKTRCKIGADPLYYDDEPNIRVSNFTFVIWNVDKLNTVALDVIDTSTNISRTIRTSKWYGNYSITFFDAYGQQWETEAIDIHGDCDSITDALESLPNNVIPKGSVRCSLDYPTKGSYISDDTTSPDITVQKYIYGMVRFSCFFCTFSSMTNSLFPFSHE